MRHPSFNISNPPEGKEMIAAAFKQLQDMRHRDVQAACIIRGMDFADIVEGDHGTIEYFFLHHYNDPVDRTLLEDYDLWMDEQLAKAGYDEDDPVRQFKKFSQIDEDDEIHVKTKSLSKARVPKKAHVKATRNKDFNIFKGTKKEYTYKLTASIFTQFGAKKTTSEMLKTFGPQLYNKVVKKYPEAKDKSVRIWMKRALESLQIHKD